ncbi:MAG: zinc ribbon domain-containing protein [Clostridia bacterium]|nr:zinc ribbon domain-containing protein [Clostridia bacterium]
MGNFKFSVGKIVTWVSSFFILLGVFGDWCGPDFIGEDSVTIFTMWDMDADGGFLGFFAILILLATLTVVFFDFFGETKLAKFISFGAGGTALLVFILALATIDPDISYGLVLLLIGGLGIPVGTVIDDILSGNIKLPTGNAAASSKKFCPNCGAQVAEGAPFCTSCGNKMN